MNRISPWGPNGGWESTTPLESPYEGTSGPTGHETPTVAPHPDDTVPVGESINEVRDRLSKDSPVVVKWEVGRCRPFRRILLLNFIETLKKTISSLRKPFHSLTGDLVQTRTLIVPSY